MNNMQTLLKHMFIHMLRIKMFHFQCPRYGQHKISDVYYESFNSKFDKFFEVAQGVYKKLKMTEIKLPSFDTCPENIDSHLDNFILLLKTLDNIIDNKELLTIRDDMVNDVSQFKYLLTFS